MTYSLGREQSPSPTFCANGDLPFSRSLIGSCLISSTVESKLLFVECTFVAVKSFSLVDSWEIDLVQPVKLWHFAPPCRPAPEARLASSNSACAKVGDRILMGRQLGIFNLFFFAKFRQYHHSSRPPFILNTPRNHRRVGNLHIIGTLWISDWGIIWGKV